MSKEELLKRLTVLDFLAVDLQLYLDTHPQDQEAIKKYNSVVEEGDIIRAKYEEMYGPLYSFRSTSKDKFTWIDCPWPWSEEANFSFDEKEE